MMFVWRSLDIGICGVGGRLVGLGDASLAAVLLLLRWERRGRGLDRFEEWQEF
jgi:hypothetical protein